MGQELSVYADNMPQLPHILPQIQDFLPKLSKHNKHDLKSENPTYLRYGDSPDPDSDPENTVNPRDQTDSRTAHQTDWAGDQADSRTGHQAEWDGDQAVPYSLHRTRIGSPSINRRSFTDEEIKRFMRENDGFPLPCSEEELKAFDEDVFVEYPTARRRKKKDRQRSKSATNVPDLAVLKLKLQKIQSPSKPKFLENLISRVSKKVSQDTNGLINALPLDTDDPETDEPLSPDSEQCLEVVESLADELIACTQRPASGESCDSGQGSSLLESTCDFSPTSKLKSWSTPTSPTFQGIVKQRLQNFQAIRETSLPPGELGKSPARKTQSLCTEKRKLQDTQLSARRFHCSLKKGDEKFTQSVMESGYVKALVSRLNRSTSFEDNEYDDSIDSRRESDDVVNGVKVNLKDENLDDWPDEFDGGNEIDNDENTGKSPRRKSHSVKDQLKKFETCSSKSNSSISSSSSWRKKSDQSNGANDSSITNVRRRSHSPKKDLDKQQNRIAEYSGAVSSNESLTDSGSSTAKTFSELQTQVSKALKRFNHERNKHISSRLTSSSASSSYSSFQNSNCVIRSPPILRRPKSSDDAKPNANNSVKGAGARTLEKRRSVELDRTSDTASSSPVSSSFDYGLMPLSPAELFDQHWSKSEFSFDDFSDDEGTNISKLKEVKMKWGDHDLHISAAAPENLSVRFPTRSDTNQDARLQMLEEEAEEEPKDKLHKIAYELLTTERAYVTRLHLLDQVFHFRVTVENKNGSFIPPDVVTQVFSHIKPIYQFHHDFLLPQLETRMKNCALQNKQKALGRIVHTTHINLGISLVRLVGEEIRSQEQRIGDIIAKLAPFLKLYTEYVKNFDNSMNLIDKWTNQSPKFASLLQEIQKDPECGQLSLQHHMLGPIQRVPRYELLLKEYLKRLDPESPDKAEAEKALELVTEAASHSNTAIKALEKFHKLLSILQNLNGEGINDLVSPTRELVKEGVITKISARSGEKQDRYLFLFNDLLLVCISQLMGKYKVRARLSVDGMEVLPGENLSIQNTFCIKCTEKTVEFLDDANNGEGLDWLAAFQNVITDFVNKVKLKRVMSDSNEVTGSKVALKDHEDLECQLLGKRAPKWIKDEEVTMCMEYSCQDKFTRIRRRHHCRACGKIYCGKCSSRKVQLEYDNNQLNRVCQKCYEIIKGDHHLEDSTEESPKTPTTPKPVTQVEADQSSVLSCYLNVMDNVKGRTWNKRWITVRDDFVLYFYKKHKDPKAMMTMPLPGHEVKVMDGSSEKLDRQRVFALSHKAANVCYFQTDNDNQLHQWTEVLKKMVLLELPSEEDKRLSAHSLDSSNSTNSSTGS